MNRLFVGFSRNVNFLLEKNILTARIPMPVEGAWRIASAKQDKLSGDMIVTFAEPYNPMVEAEQRHHNAFPGPDEPAERKCRFEAQNAH